MENEIKTESKQNKTIAIIAIIVVLLIGIGVYFLFIRKPSEPPKGGSEEQGGNKQTETGESEYSKNLDKVVYKSKDGKKVFTIYSPKDEEMNKKAREELKSKESDEYDDDDYFIKDGNYLGSYNNKLIVVRLGEEISNEDKYGIFMSDRLGESSQCGSYFFIVNDKTNELLDFDYDNYQYYGFENIGNKYIFVQGTSCVDGNKAVYNEDLKKVADNLVEIDKDNKVFYAIKDNYLTKLDQDGNVVKKSNLKYDNKTIIGQIVVVNKNAYVLIKINDLIYLYDFEAGTKYKVYNGSKSDVCNFDYNECYSAAQIKALNNKIRIVLNPAEATSAAYSWTYLFDVSTKKLDHIGYFLIEDGNESPEYFYIFNDDNNIYEVYKYDKNGNVVTKNKYDESEVYSDTNDYHAVAYKGNLFLLRLDNDKYYLVDAFTNEKYEIAGKDECNSITIDNEEKDYVATNLIKIELFNEKNEIVKELYFNVDTKKLEK